MDYEKKYKEALERAKTLYENANGMILKKWVEKVFPELAESEDERIRKEIKQFIRSRGMHLAQSKVESWVAWLEKQGEQKQKHFELKAGHWYICHRAFCCRADHLTVKEGERFMCEKDGVVKGFVIKEPEKYFKEVCAPAPMEEEQKPATDNVEPKIEFKVGQWIVATGECEYLIAKIDDFNVTLIDTNGDEYMFDASSLDDAYQWTIQDAKEGDVLCCENGWTCIFKALDNHTNTFSSYCFMDSYKWFCNIGIEGHTLDKAFIKAYNGDIHPATKEQRDLLFQKMHEAGYEWDAEKKELKKIEQNPAVFSEQKPAWSEEDEDAIAEAIIALEDMYDPDEPERRYAGYTLTFDKAAERLKSLRPQNRWKPSKGQMNALLWCVAHLGGADHRVLGELYEHLKQLTD